MILQYKNERLRICIQLRNVYNYSHKQRYNSFDSELVVQNIINPYHGGTQDDKPLAPV